MKVKVSMTIDEDVYERFKHYCQQNGMKISTKVEQLIRQEMKNKSLHQYMNEEPK